MERPWRFIRRLALGLFLIAAAAALLLISDLDRGGRPAATLPRVAVFQYSTQPIMDDGVRGILDSLRDHGYIQDRTMQLKLFNAENDMPTLNSIAQELTGGRFDYVFTVSTNCLQAIAKANRSGRVKHVFGVVADPIGAGVGINPKDPLDHPKNMVGIGTLAPIQDILAIIKTMNPQVKRVGLPWNHSQSNSETYTKLARAAAPKLGIKLLESNVDATTAVGEVVASLVAQNAEAILVTGDLTVSLAIDAVVSEALKGGVPVFSTQPDTITRGVILAFGGDYYQIGRDTGDLAARVLGGDDINRMPIQYDLPQKLVINRKVIPRLKSSWVFPEEVLVKATDVTDNK